MFVLDIQSIFDSDIISAKTFTNSTNNIKNNIILEKTFSNLTKNIIIGNYDNVESIMKYFTKKDRFLNYMLTKYDFTEFNYFMDAIILSPIEFIKNKLLLTFFNKMHTIQFGIMGNSSNITSKFYDIYLFIICEQNKYSIFKKIKKLFESDEDEIIKFFIRLEIIYFMEKIDKNVLKDYIFEHAITINFECNPVQSLKVSKQIDFSNSDPFYFISDIDRYSPIIQLITRYIVKYNRIDVVETLIESTEHCSFNDEYDEYYCYSSELMDILLRSGNLSIIKELYNYSLKKNRLDNNFFYGNVIKKILLQHLYLRNYDYVVELINISNSITYAEISNYLPENFKKNYIPKIKNIFTFFNIKTDNEKQELIKLVGEKLYLEKLVFYQPRFIAIWDFQKYINYKGHYLGYNYLHSYDDTKKYIDQNILLIHLGFINNFTNVTYEYAKQKNVGFLNESMIEDALKDGLSMIDIYSRFPHSILGTIDDKLKLLNRIIQKTICYYGNFHNNFIKNGIIDVITKIIENNDIFNNIEFMNNGVSIIESIDGNNNFINKNKYDILFSPLIKYCLNYENINIIELLKTIDNQKLRVKTIIDNLDNLNNLEEISIESFDLSDKEISVTDKLVLCCLTNECNKLLEEGDIEMIKSIMECHKIINNYLDRFENILYKIFINYIDNKFKSMTKNKIIDFINLFNGILNGYVDNNFKNRLMSYLESFLHFIEIYGTKRK